MAKSSAAISIELDLARPDLVFPPGGLRFFDVDLRNFVASKPDSIVFTRDSTSVVTLHGWIVTIDFGQQLAGASPELATMTFQLIYNDSVETS